MSTGARLRLRAPSGPAPAHPPAHAALLGSRRPLAEPLSLHQAARVAASPAPVQARLAVGRPGDRYEQEAGRVAQAVLQAPGATGPRRPPPVPVRTFRPAAPGIIQRWLTRDRALPARYQLGGRAHSIDKTHEDITEASLGQPAIAPLLNSEARRAVVARSGFLDRYKAQMRQHLPRTRFDQWEARNHGFTREGSSRQRSDYLAWAVDLANNENNLAEALRKLGDALHVAQDMHAHLFTPPGCSPWPGTSGAQAACSLAQDDPQISPERWRAAHRDSLASVLEFHHQLTDDAQGALAGS